MTAATLSLVAGTLLSLLFSYIPKANGTFQSMDGIYKRLIMLGCLGIVAIGVFALSCFGIGESLGIYISCDQTGAIGLVAQFVLAMIANQSTFAISPQKKAK